MVEPLIDDILCFDLRLFLFTDERQVVDCCHIWTIELFSLFGKGKSLSFLANIIKNGPNLYKLFDFIWHQLRSLHEILQSNVMMLQFVGD